MAFNRIIEISIISQTGKAFIIKDLHISFTVEKTIAQSANKGTVRIWNLSESTRTSIKAKDKIIVKAGYEDEGTANLFFGDIQIVTDSKDSTDRITEIEAFDGQSAIQNTDITCSFSAGTSVQSVFQYIRGKMGLPLANKEIVLPGQYAGGYSFVGKAKDAMTQVLLYAGYAWSIQNEQIVIHNDFTVVQKTGLNISPTTGLIGSPQIINDTDTNQNEGQRVLKRWGVKSLLFPQLIPGASVQVTANEVKGIFKIETVIYDADNMEGEFVSNMEVVEML